MLAAAMLLAPPAGADAIDDVVREEMRGQGIPGLALAVVRQDGTVKFAGHGEANVGHHAANCAAAAFSARDSEAPPWVA